MSIGPRGPLLKNDGPACRVCGCTENNACTELGHGARERTRGNKIEIVRERVPIGCHWVKVEAGTEPLCSACSGTDADLSEVVGRMRSYIRQHGSAAEKLTILTATAALKRWNDRRKLSS